MRKKHIALSIIIAFAGLACHVDAEIKPAKIFTDNMVLQHDMKVPVWGTPAPGEAVTVEFAGQKKETKADKDGNWMLRLDPLKISKEGRVLKISGIELKNVLVGEVWLGAGQSNMSYKTGVFMEKDTVLAEMVTSGPYPNLRLYHDGAWKVADEATTKSFSAIHFAFGLNLHKEFKVPVGLMVGAVSGTPSGRWITKEMFSADAALLKMLKEEGGYDGIDDMYTKWRAGMEKAQADAKAAGRPRPRFRQADRIGVCYNKEIGRFVPYGIRGVLWDQGEAGTAIPGVDQYTTMNALISGWRNVWGQGDFYFLHVQKPSGGGCAWDPENPVNKWARPFGRLPETHITNPSDMQLQLNHIKMATIKNAPIVTTVDLCPKLHPPIKSAYGKRACRVALGAVYGHDVAICGPVYKSHKVEGSTIRVSFNHTDKGLAYKHGDRLQGFEICGSDGKWEWADAKLDGDTVVLSNEKVVKPINVQYAFNKSCNFANLFNQAGLPALMFTTVEH